MLPGRRFENPEVEFAGAGPGAFSDAYTAGNVGAGFLRAFRTAFDYGNKRVAFAPLGAAKAAGAVSRRSAGLARGRPGDHSPTQVHRRL